MKKLTIYLLLLLPFLSNAQIIFEHTYPGPNSISQNRLQLVNLANNEFKYIYTDYSRMSLRYLI